MPRSGYDLTDALPGSAAEDQAARGRARRTGDDPETTPRASHINARGEDAPAQDAGSPATPTPRRMAPPPGLQPAALATAATNHDATMMAPVGQLQHPPGMGAGGF
ncbi:hypothetical protein ACCO45_013618 [Purpureocillium lilacinum]|uniref:Uncharacterized protein n=1 Tax=Purpureocillium lilacinum TaxID=33203 RepID=A0ACC4D6J2_PURLI